MSLINLLFEFIIPTFFKIFILFLISISFRLILQKVGQTWIKTISHTVTLSILPIITFIITSVISGNIALSLGMVGALSIVRFRNPVRSPLELTVYFAAITMGITASVSWKWLILFAFSIYLIILLLFLFFITTKNITKKNFFITSFSEGNALSTLEVTSSKTLKVLDQSDLIKSISFSENGKKQYLLASNDFNKLRNLILEIEKDQFIINYQLNEC